MIRSLAMTSLLLFSAVAAVADTFPVVEEVTPAQGSIAGGAVVTLRGRNLARSSAVACTFVACEPSVSIGGKDAPIVEVAADGTRLQVRTPPNAGGTYDIYFSFRTRTTFVGQTFVSAPFDDGVTLNRAFTYGSGGYERVLVPIFAKGETPGAFGSRWVTELVGWNPSPFSIGVYRLPPPNPPFPGPNTPEPEWGAKLSSFRPQLDGPSFLYVAGTASLGFQLRVRDLTRQSESWGTEIPVVPESKAFVGTPILLNNIPFGAGTRVMLRIYDFDGPTGGKVDVEVHFDDASVNEQFALDTLDFPAGTQQEFPTIPGLIQLDLTSELATVPLPLVKNAKSLRVAVVAHDTDKRLWAFATVTNNVTQQITTVTPQQ